MCDTESQVRHNSFSIIYSLEEINILAQCILGALPDKSIVLLNGQLGSGKTTFVRALCEELKIKDQVSSPSYVLENQYSNEETNTLVRHWDLFRVSNDYEIFQDIISFSQSSKKEIVLVEWSEIVPDLFNEATLTLNFKTISEDEIEKNSRKLELAGQTIIRKNFIDFFNVL